MLIISIEIILCLLASLLLNISEITVWMYFNDLGMEIKGEEDNKVSLHITYQNTYYIVKKYAKMILYFVG